MLMWVWIGPMVEVPLDDVKGVFETNVFAILRMCRAVVPLMAARKSGTIVNIGSVVGEMYVLPIIRVPPLTRHFSSGTPWNGIYCASKAAVLSISEVLSMELKPLGIAVVHVAPAAIKSNIATNGHARFALTPNTLFGAYLPDIIRRINSSQGAASMPSAEFARRVVAGVLGAPPRRYMSLGGGAWMFALFKWLPRGLVLMLIWRRFSKKQ